jgi:hypothetical protein
MPQRWIAGPLIAGALTVGALGAALGGRLGWSSVVDLPDDRQAVAIVKDLVPGTRLRAPDLRDDTAFRGRVVFRVDPPSQNVAGAVGVARDELAAGFFTIRPRAADHPGQVEGVIAVRGDLVVQVYQEGAATLVLELGRTPPSPVGPLVALAGLGGLGLGWAGMRRVAASTRPAAVAAWSGVVLLAPGTVLTYPAVAAMYVAPMTAPVASWAAYTGPVLGSAAVLGGLLLVIAAVLTVRARRASAAAALMVRDRRE